MEKHTFLVFVAYVWTKTLIGLTFYPFRFTKKVARRPILFPIVFSPLIGLTVLFITGRIAALFLSPTGFKREIVVLFLSTTLISIIFWQILLFYLLGSYILALRKRA